MFFFFQAEDGIRDKLVTGVQTCALPISTVALPLPVRKDNASQPVLVSFADKTEPMAFNYYATGAYMLPRFNTGLIIAASKMKRGYIMDIVDLDTKAQAIEAGAHPRDQKALDGKMEE